MWGQKYLKINNKGWCGPCKGPRCEICKHTVPTRNLTSSTTKRTYKIRPENLNCRSKNVVYLIPCKTCHKQYTGSSEEFRARINNYRSAHRNYHKNRKVKQESFHAHFADDFHSGKGDWEVRLIDQSDSTENLRKRESFWTWHFLAKWFEWAWNGFTLTIIMHKSHIFLYLPTTSTLHLNFNKWHNVLFYFIYILIFFMIIVININIIILRIIIITISIIIMISVNICLFIYLFIYPYFFSIYCYASRVIVCV